VLLFLPSRAFAGATYWLMTKPDPERKPKIPAETINQRGGINPSSPNVGTSGYGMHPGEPTAQDIPRSVSEPDTRGSGDVRRISYPLPEWRELMDNKSQQDEMKNSPNKRIGKSLRCADVGNTSCNWSVVGEHEDEIMGKAEQHAREAHGIKHFDDNTKKRVYDAIRNRAA
jgi:predicted small metal-binding protein